MKVIDLWKSQKEIDKESEVAEKKEKAPTSEERIQALEQALVSIMMERKR